MWLKRLLGFIPEASIVFLSTLVFWGAIAILDLGVPDLSPELLILLFGSSGVLVLTCLLAWDASRLGDSSAHNSQGIIQNQDLSFVKEWARQGLKYFQILLVFFVVVFWLVGSPSSQMLSMILWLPLALSVFLNIRALKENKDLLHNTLMGVQLTETDISMKRFSWPLRLLGVGALVGLLILIALPNVVGGCGSAPSISSVKANMHTFQTMVETYGVDWGGVYPDNVSILQKEATKTQDELSSYWKDFANPYLGSSGFGKSFADEGMSPEAGLVTYLVQQDLYGQNTAYAIYGYNKDAVHIVDKGKTFFLSNY